MTMRLTHGGDFVSTPGHSIDKPKVCYVDWVNIYKLDMDMLERISKSLGYESPGFWYVWNTDEQFDFGMMSLNDNNQIGKFRKKIEKERFQVVQHVYVEHRRHKVPYFYPNTLQKEPVERIKRLVYCLVSENPSATVDDGIKYIYELIGVFVPPNRVIEGMELVRESVKSRMLTDESVSWNDM